MRKLMIVFSFATLLLLLVFGVMRRAYGQTQPGEPVILAQESQGESLREIIGLPGEAPAQPEIGFIDSPTAACVQPDPAKNDCYINWYYLSVDAAPNYMISMTVALNEFGFVANYNGFFQTSMYAPYNMNPQGYKVVCGALGAGGHPALGKAYGYTIRARDSAGLKSANYGTVYCPAYTP
ncbi:MAG: hypothetical protein L0Z70_16335 [Chloroflexi bacterium]|nr:hypothetical protein [Chloroflexota bacterium]